MAAVQQLLDCMVSSWYPRFARATFKTVLVPLPQPVLDWLVADGLHLPEDTQAFAKRGAADEYAMEGEYKDEWSEGEGEEDDGSSAAAQPPPGELDEVRRQLAAGIEELGGRVVPKLSWSCPKDAIWLSPSSSLCCTNADEVLLLLRSSDRVAHDICSALQEAAAAAAAGGAAAECSDAASGAPVQHYLALRRWHDLQPGREFRCFVRAQQLVGACQRDVTQRFEFLRGERGELEDALQAFHAKHIGGRFPHAQYTYDVYVATSGAVKLLDFNPMGGTTAPLLFSWEELRLGPAPGSTSGTSGGGGGEHEAAAGGEHEAAVGGEQQPAAVGGEEAAGGCTQHAARGGAAHAAPGDAAGCGCCQQGDAAGSRASAVPGVADGEPPSYLEQLRRVRALSLAGQQAAAGSDGSAGSTAAADPPAAGTCAGSPGAASAPAATSPTFELRIIEEEVALRPAAAAYGVPYDFVDSTEGSALDRLMAQAGGGGELWAALAARGGAR